MDIFEEVVIFVFSYGYILAAIPFGLGIIGAVVFN
jgi:hypothetical protein